MQSLKRLLRILFGYVHKMMGLPVNCVASPALSIETWIEQLNSNLPPLRAQIAILAGRNYTWVEWAVYAACWMRKLGLGPVIIYSRKTIENIYRMPQRKGSFHNIYYWLRRSFYTGNFWKKAAKIPDAVLIDVDQEDEPDPSAIKTYIEFAKDWAKTTAAYDMRLEESEKGPLQDLYLERVTMEEKKLARWGALIEKILRRLIKDYAIQRIVVYSGLIDVTPIVGETARRLGLDVAYAETWGVKPGIMICNINAPALDWDVHSWMETQSPWDDRQSSVLERFLAFQETNKVTDVEWLQGHLQYQRSSVDEKIDGRLLAFLSDIRPIMLMAPNVIADSGTLRRRLIFDTQREWINETCSFFREHPELKLVIRAHPAEYLLRRKVKIRIGDMAKEAAAGASNIFIIDGEEDVNTYALIPFIHAALVWVSNVGADFVIRNCPVVAAARSSYFGLGIAHEPKDKKEYFSLIMELAESRKGTSEKQKELGKKYLSILYRERPFLAFSPSYGAVDVNLIEGPTLSDFERFYKIIAGDLPVETRPRALDKPPRE